MYVISINFREHETGGQRGKNLHYPEHKRAERA